MDESPRLIIIRGNSGSGKSTLAAELRLHTGRKCALVGQHMLRRVVLKEKETEGGDNIGLIEQTVRFTLGRGYDVVLEGVLARSRYGPMLGRLANSHPFTYAYYVDVSFEETRCRHAGKPNAPEFGEKEMRGWWLEKRRPRLLGREASRCRALAQGKYRADRFRNWETPTFQPLELMGTFY